MPPALRRPTRSVLLVALALAVAAPLLPAPLAEASEDPLEATIRWTSHGIPHILADDYAGLGFGYGYAFASLNICTAAEFYVTVSGERSKYFGPDGTWIFRGNGSVNTNLDSDFFYKRTIEMGIVEQLIDPSDPHAPRQEIRDGVRGYVAGYNQWLRETGVDNITDPRCRGAEWVREIDEMDVYRRFYQLASLASTAVAIDEIGGAQPLVPGVGGGAGVSALEDPSMIAELESRFEAMRGIGSNAYGLGREVTESGRGIVLVNPHFPWYEGERLFQSQLTIPGQANVAGGSLYGVPLILLGHTDGMGWTHTVSPAYRFTPIELTLVPGSPTTYLVDGQPREMEPVPLTVEVRHEDGSIGEVSRTLYNTEYGPMTLGILGLPIFPWTPVRAWAIGDANEWNFRYLNYFFEKNHAQSVRELHEIQKRQVAVPWVHTTAADRDGEVYYSDISVVPNVPDSKAIECGTPLGLAIFAAMRLPILDGSRSACAWDTDPDAPAPGIFGPSNLPHLFRDDHVSQMNDSHWLSNPDEPLTGFATIIGDEETARTLRTRLGIINILDRVDGADGLPGDRFTVENLTEIAFNNRQHAAELTRDALVSMCESLPGGFALSSSGPVNVAEACPVLADWDLRDDLDSPGALLFRRFWQHAQGAEPSPWLNPFDVDDPVNTPNTLNTLHPQVILALGDAVNDLAGAGIPVDGLIRNHQFTRRGGDLIPVHGGPGGLGVFNATNPVWRAGEGYVDVQSGTSIVMAIGFTDDDCPDVRSIVTYGQSEDITSPYFNDQTRMFSEKVWNDVPFCEDEIAANPDLEIVHIRSDGPPVDEPVDAAPAPDLPATGGGIALALLVLLAAALARARSRT